MPMGGGLGEAALPWLGSCAVTVSPLASNLWSGAVADRADQGRRAFLLVTARSATASYREAVL